MLFILFSLLITLQIHAMKDPADNNNLIEEYSSSKEDNATTILLQKLSLKGIEMEVGEFEELIEEGADLYFPDENGQTALHHIVFHAVSSGNPELVKACCKKNVDWKTKHINTESPYEICKRASNFTRVTNLTHGKNIFAIIDKHTNHLTSQDQ